MVAHFFKQNIGNLASYFKITDVNQAIYDTIEDSERLQCLIMDISPDANLDEIFRPLENSRISEMLLGKEMARLRNAPRHASWLRIYAIKLEPGIYSYNRRCNQTYTHHAGAGTYIG